MKSATITKETVITRMGIDISKNVFQFHGVDGHEKIQLRKAVKRDNVLEFMANKKPCFIGMEACGGSHYWGREFEKLGHTVRLMPGQHVSPYRKNNKNDSRDAEAICEAVQRPTMLFVPIKTQEQQDMQSLHRARQEMVKIRTMHANQLRGLLLEYGIAIPEGISQIRKTIPCLLEDAENSLTSTMRFLIHTVYEFLCTTDKNIAEITDKIESFTKSNDLCKRILQIDGFGPLSSTAFVSAVGSGKQFKCGRDASAWLGVVPRQYSTGGKTVLLGISKKGNRYLRSLLVNGSRAVVSRAKGKTDKQSKWIQELVNKKGVNKAVVAYVNKMVRIAWSMIQSGEEYRKAA
jgi:transposase